MNWFHFQLARLTIADESKNPGCYTYEPSEGGEVLNF